MPSDAAFTGSVPVLYDQVLVPFMFAPYARDLAARIAAETPGRVLEVACGTGAVTFALREALPDCAIVATDLNEAMLGVARSRESADTITWQTANAQDLPFEAGSFAAVACQFGIMFFPDPAKALAEMARVLRPGGTAAINVWGSLEANPAAGIVEETVVGLFPEDPPRFIRRTPHGHGDPAPYEALLRKAGFAEVGHAWVDAVGHAPSAQVLAEGYCLGTPLRGELEARRPGAAQEAVAPVARALAARFGEGAIAAPIRAYVLTARRA